ncbi:MAG: hypothetical protein AMS20_13345 [Gemmatimonas sp. SG8_28]|jgi:hypothetical protein|nr:MAG: hypothetical protein AMS20_13345 [Gemmatimonas sp. SG8_28]
MPERSSDGRRPWRERVLPYRLLVPVALVLGLAPLRPEPHLVEKLRMLFGGTLSRPIDIFDLVLHGTPAVLLMVRVAADLVARARRTA